MTSSNKTKKELLENLAKAEKRIAELEIKCKQNASTQKNKKNTPTEYQIVSEATHAEEELRFYSQILHHLNEGIYLIRASDSKILFTNPAIEHMFGYEPDELVGQHASVVNAPTEQDPEEIAAKITSQLNETGMWQGEVLNIRKDGTTLWCSATTRTFQHPEYGSIWISMHQDITAHKQFEGILKTKEQYLQLFFQSTGDCIWNWDMDFDTVERSIGFVRAFGYGAEDIDPDINWWIERLHPDDKNRIMQAFYAAVDSGQTTTSYEYRFRCKDGSYADIDDHICLIRDDNGRIIRSLGAMRDITERKHSEAELDRHRMHLEELIEKRTADLEEEIHQRKQSEKALIEARKYADKANKAKSQFLTRMSHEFRTPLNAILGFAQLLDRITPEHQYPDQSASIKQIVNAGWHLLDVVNDLLDLAAIEANKVELHTEAVDLSKNIQDSIKTIQPLSDQRQITIHYKLEQFSNQNVQADSIRLKQVLLNLLSNAVKYNKTGGSVTLSCEKLAADKVRINITDTGSGIPDDDLQTLFEPFSRLYLRTRASEGTGIGLTISKQLMERMGGCIGVTSKPGYGSTFWIELQLSQPKSQAAPETIAIVEDPKLPEDLLMKATVLYIEDSPSHIQLVENIVKHMKGIELITAHTPQLGLELAKAHMPDLIVLDICLPDMDGFEVLKHLRKPGFNSDIPIIAVSANAMLSDIEKGLEAGFDRYLTKPIDIVEFQNTMKALLPKNLH